MRSMNGPCNHISQPYFYVPSYFFILYFIFGFSGFSSYFYCLISFSPFLLKPFSFLFFDLFFRLLLFFCFSLVCLFYLLLVIVILTSLAFHFIILNKLISSFFLTKNINSMLLCLSFVK